MIERREFIRYDCHLILAVRSEQSKVVEFEGRAVNLSRGGLVFTTTMELKMSQLVMIAFDNDDNQIYTEGIVIRKEEPEAEGNKAYAVKFPIMLSEEELQTLFTLSTANLN